MINTHQRWHISLDVFVESVVEDISRFRCEWYNMCIFSQILYFLTCLPSALLKLILSDLLTYVILVGLVHVWPLTCVLLTLLLLWGWFLFSVVQETLKLQVYISQKLLDTSNIPLSYKKLPGTAHHIVKLQVILIIILTD